MSVEFLALSEPANGQLMYDFFSNLQFDINLAIN